MKQRITFSGIIKQLRSQQLRIIVIALVIVIAHLLATSLTPYYQKPQAQFFQQEQQDVVYMRAQVTNINGEQGTAQVLDGAQKGQSLPIQFYGAKPELNSTVLISVNATFDEPNAVTQTWRLPVVIWILATMIILVVLIGGRQGLMSILGLGISIGVVALFVIPRVLEGANALSISIIGAFMVATISIIVAHSWRWRTFVSLLGIYVVLGVVVLIAWLSGYLASLTGVYDETSSMLSFGRDQHLDMYGILLGGIIIASLGVLDDVVTTQVAAVDELKKAKPHASKQELFSRGMSVGREHLSALINTLALAYVGVAMPTILILSQNISTPSQFLVSLNYEYISVEIIRMAVSSIGIILAIPLSTALAVVLISRKQQVIGILRRVKPNFRR